MGEADVTDAVGGVLAVLREAGRPERTVRVPSGCAGTVRRVSWPERGLGTVSERVCIDFVENRPGSGWGRCESRSTTGM